jgi:hypothetical protein
MAIYTVSITDGTTLANLAVAAGRGPKGDGFTGVTFDNATKTFTFTSNDGLGFTSDPITIDLLADPTPQLGGNLDLNSNDITGTGDINITGGMTLTGAINGPSTFTIDPAGHGDNTGTVIIAGNLQVDGTTTTINSQTLDVADLNITVASGAADAASADGAGLTVDGANATLTYVAAGDKWVFNKPVDVTTLTATTADINGGTIDGTVIGGSTAAAISGTTGQFGTSLNVDGTVTADGLTVDGNNSSIAVTSGTDQRALYLKQSNDYGYSFNLDSQTTGDLLLKGVTNGTETTRLKISRATGDISFYEDTGTTPKFFWDASAESLGIGTTSPSAPLSVTYAGGAVGAQITGNASYAQMQLSAVGANTNAYFTFGANGTGKGIIQRNATDAITIDASANVGIGTSSPSEKLEVAADANSRIKNQEIGGNSSIWLQQAVSSYLIADSDWRFYTNSLERAVIDSSGNLGLGVTPSAWPSTLKVMQFGSGAAYSTLTSNDTAFASNLYADTGGTARYLNTSNATLYRQVVGQHFWYNAPSGTAGDPITLTQAMTLDASGNLLVGKTSASSTIAGVQAISDGRLFATVSNDHTLIGNRLSSDGAIATFQKDGTTVGSIGSTGGTGEVYIANNDSVGLKFTNVDAIVPSTHTGGGANRDAAIDLGYSSGGTNVRFKDLYLSGGLRGDTTFKNNAGTTEYARFDASGNLLVGKTTSALATAGTALRGDNAGLINSARAGTILELNRLSTDGSIVDFYKDGTTVGSIAAGSSNLIIGTGNTAVRFWDAGTAVLPRTPADGVSNGVIDLGEGSNRFKNLYLSGGVYLGGTGSANLLDDYEEGTWTATYVGSATAGSSPTATRATYTRVGNIVVATCSFKNATASGAAGNMYITGLPFAASNGADGEHFASAAQTGLGPDVLGGSVINGESIIRMRDVLTTVYEPVVNTSGFYLFITMTYTAA